MQEQYKAKQDNTPRQPIDKGRVVVAVERFESKERNQYGEPKMKSRFATVGRANMWASDTNGTPRVDLELDTLPIGHFGKLKLSVFWDSESKNN